MSLLSHTYSLPLHTAHPFSFRPSPSSNLSLSSPSVSSFPSPFQFIHIFASQAVKEKEKKPKKERQSQNISFLRSASGVKDIKEKEKDSDPSPGLSHVLSLSSSFTFSSLLFGLDLLQFLLLSTHSISPSFPLLICVLSLTLFLLDISLSLSPIQPHSGSTLPFFFIYLLHSFNSSLFLSLLPPPSSQLPQMTSFRKIFTSSPYPNPRRSRSKRRPLTSCWSFSRTRASPIRDSVTPSY